MSQFHAWLIFDYIYDVDIKNNGSWFHVFSLLSIDVNVICISDCKRFCVIVLERLAFDWMMAKYQDFFISLLHY